MICPCACTHLHIVYISSTYVLASSLLQVSNLKSPSNNALPLMISRRIPMTCARCCDIIAMPFGWDRPSTKAANCSSHFMMISVYLTTFGTTEKKSKQTKNINCCLVQIVGPESRISKGTKSTHISHIDITIFGRLMDVLFKANLYSASNGVQVD